MSDGFEGDGGNTPTPPLNAHVTVHFDMGEVHDISLDLLRSLEDSNVEISTGAAALALSIGRVLSARTLDNDQEIAFIQAMFEWCAMYFHEGVTN